MSSYFTRSANKEIKNRAQERKENHDQDPNHFIVAPEFASQYVNQRYKPQKTDEQANKDEK
jgi:hypothetical protein